MRRIFRVFRSLGRVEVSEDKTVMSKVQAHKQFKRTMAEALALASDLELEGKEARLMTPVPSWGQPVQIVVEGSVLECLQKAQEGSRPAFDHPLGGLSPELRRRLARL